MFGTVIPCPSCSRQIQVPQPPPVPVPAAVLPPALPSTPPVVPQPALVSTPPPLPAGYLHPVEAILKTHAGQTDLFLRGSIPSKREASARTACGLKSDEPLFALVDCTIFGSAKHCLLFTPNGIYVHSSSMPRGVSHIMVPYAEFSTRQFAVVPGTKQVDLGNNQVLDAENSAVPVSTLIAILWQIKNGMKGNSIADEQGVADLESKEPAAKSVRRKCPICKGVRIEDEISEKGGTAGAVVGGLLFGGMGSVLGRTANTERVVQNHCLTCHHKWTD
jgi:hypothetical protein